MQYIPPELFELWDESARQWAAVQYHGPELTAVRERYIEIYRQLPHVPVGLNAVHWYKKPPAEDGDVIGTGGDVIPVLTTGEIEKQTPVRSKDKQQ